MPLPLADVAGIAAVALATGLAPAAITWLPGGEGAPAQVLRLVILTLGFLAAVWRYDVVGVAGVVRRRLARVVG